MKEYSNNLNMFAGLGYTYFITNQVGIELVGNFEGRPHLVVNSNTIFNFGIRAGFQIYLSKQNYKCNKRNKGMEANGGNDED